MPTLEEQLLAAERGNNPRPLTSWEKEIARGKAQRAIPQPGGPYPGPVQPTTYRARLDGMKDPMTEEEWQRAVAMTKKGWNGGGDIPQGGPGSWDNLRGPIGPGHPLYDPIEYPGGDIPQRQERPVTYRKPEDKEQQYLKYAKAQEGWNQEWDRYDPLLLDFLRGGRTGDQMTSPYYESPGTNAVSHVTPEHWNQITTFAEKLKGVDDDWGYRQDPNRGPNGGLKRLTGRTMADYPQYGETRNTPEHFNNIAQTYQNNSDARRNYDVNDYMDWLKI